MSFSLRLAAHLPTMTEREPADLRLVRGSLAPADDCCISGLSSNVTDPAPAPTLLEHGVLVALPVEMPARVLFSALCEAAMTAVEGKDLRKARQDASHVLRALVGGLRPAPERDGGRERGRR
jgi:hypothetical protein